MATHAPHPLIDDLLRDPMIIAVMRADRVDPIELRTMLYTLADELDEATDRPVPQFALPLGFASAPIEGLRAF